MGTIGNPLTPPLTLRMICYNLTGVPDNHAASHDHDLYGFANEAPRYRVAVRVQIDGAIGAHFTDQVSQLAERSPFAQRTQRVYLIGVGSG